MHIWPLIAKQIWDLHKGIEAAGGSCDPLRSRRCGRASSFLGLQRRFLISSHFLPPCAGICPQALMLIHVALTLDWRRHAFYALGLKARLHRENLKGSSRF